MRLIREPLLTRVVTPQTLDLPSRSTYIYCQDGEDRSAPNTDWRAAAENNGACFVEVRDCDELIQLCDLASNETVEFHARQRRPAVDFFRVRSDCYLDITGMSYSVWVPLLRAAIDAGTALRVVYTEPMHYRRSSTPTQEMQFDLSEGSEGIQPVPGLASILVQESSDWHLVAALGFEGDRFSRVLNDFEPPANRVHPIIGAPGFRPEFTAVSFISNQAGLLGLDGGANVRFARANCPFEMYHTLRKIHEKVSGSFLRIAAIGTKPHGLGAVLYAISNPRSVQLVHDNPKRKAKRTAGASRVLVYEVSTFAQSDLYLKPMVVA